MFQESIATLTATLEQAQSVHSDLLQVKQSLEHDIFIKTNSLVIDRSKCLPLRTEFPFHLWCGCKKCKTWRTETETNRKNMQWNVIRLKYRLWKIKLLDDLRIYLYKLSRIFFMNWFIYGDRDMVIAIFFKRWYKIYII